jgi:hypothetical protein
MHLLHLLHLLNMLTAGFNHVHDTRPLFRYYLDHHALAFLRSGITSGNGGRSYLWWLAMHHITPADW